MDARYTTPHNLFDGEKQFVVPLFQRVYSWTPKQWNTLWEDLLVLVDRADERPHFIGSLVMLPTNTVPAGVSKYAVIDGQQRLTTLAVLLLALRDAARQAGQAALADRINGTYLLNNYAEHEHERYKLLPTQSDRAAFRHLASGQAANEPPPAAANGSGSEAPPQLRLAYTFFRKRLAQWLLRPGHTADQLLALVLRRLSLVSIVLDDKDDPYLVFESLNAKGLQLTAADLIRNYLFMRLPQNGREQEEFNTGYWEPMQQLLGGQLTSFIWHYLLMREGGNVRQTEVYLEFKKLADARPVEDVLRSLSHYAPFYARILRPALARPERPAVATALARLERLRFTVAYPLVLRLYENTASGILPEAALLQVLAVLENYVMRRFMAGRDTMGSNRVMQALTQRVVGLNPADPAALLGTITEYLAGQGYATDERVRAALLTDPMYHTGERSTRTKLLLETLNADLNQREQVAADQLTIEHIMPQTLNAAWRAELGSEADDEHRLLLHTLGNLTLTGYNSELSNSPFAAKKALFGQSNVALNAELAAAPNWDGAASRARGERLADQVLRRWPSFAPTETSAAGSNSEDGNGRTASVRPRAVVLLGARHPVSTWVEVATATLRACANTRPALYAQLAQLKPHYLNQDPAALRSAGEVVPGWFYERHQSAEFHQKFCRLVLAEVGLQPADWLVETAASAAAE